MKATEWRPYKQGYFRDAIRCACGAQKPAKSSVLGWSRRFDPKKNRTEYRCPRCTREAA